MHSPDVRLRIDGRIYGGWQEITLRRSMDQLAATFELRLTDRWAGQDTVRPIMPGAACTVLVDDEPYLHGYVDDAAPAYDAKRYAITVSGRDKAGDLADCAAPSTQFAGRTLVQVAAELCKPYGIGVLVSTPAPGIFDHLKTQEGDSVLETLEAAARVRGVLLLSDGLGHLLITRAATTRISTPLALGKTVLRCRAYYSHRDRYSLYTVKGQSAGSDDWYGEDAAQPQGTAADAAVTRYRPLTVLAEESIDPAAARKRAQWERAVRYGRSRRLSYTVPGWRHADGLWEPNHLVRVRDTLLDVDEDRLIAGVTLMLDEDGCRARLDIAPRQAYELMAMPEPEEADLW